VDCCCSLTFLTVNVLAGGPMIVVDQHIHHAVQRAANSADWSWLKAGPAAPGRILVDLGNYKFAFPVLLAVAGYAAFRRGSLRPLLTAGTGIVLTLAIVVPAKIAIGRPGPGQLRTDDLLGAFPSGHATTACVCYVLAALLIAPAPGSRVRRIALSGAVALSVLIGTALIWCDLHWFTDVIAGFALAGLIVPLAVWITRRGRGSQLPGRPPDESRTLAASVDRPGPGG
jgi:membrane-associated phospholipid phosphatase